MAEEKIINYKDMNYIVSSDGHVYSTYNKGAAKYHKELKQRYTKDGYTQITVGHSGNRTSCRVHRLVAMAFVPNPDNLPEINHKDCNRANNCAENLEWCTHEYNIEYSIKNGNHISTKDISGSNNPNYGNHALSEKYKNNPELALKNQRRPGAKNGRSIKIKLIDIIDNKEFIFDYIRAASEYIIKNGFSKAKDIDSVSARLSEYAKNGKIYKHRFRVEFMN